MSYASLFTKMKNSNISLCPYCEKQTDIISKNINETIKVLNDEIETVSEILQCSVCGGEFTTFEIEEKNYQKAYDIYRKRHNLLPPEKIKEIRTALNLSLYEFGLLFNLNEKTINNIEEGYPYIDEINEQIISIQETGEALKLLDKKQEDLPKGYYSSIKNKLIKALNHKQTIQFIFNNKKLDLETGFRSFNINKVENMILYIIKKVNNVGKTKLNKLLFYCDFKYFKEYTVSITGINYIHLPLGPVPDNYEIIINDLIDNKKILNEEKIYHSFNLKSFSGEIYTHLTEPDLSLFNNNEIKVMDNVISNFKSLSAKKIKNKSHNEEAYNKTNELETISYKYAKTLSI